MTSWRPAEREPDALRGALHDYLRSRAADVYLKAGSGGAPSLGRLAAIGSHGRSIVIELSLMPAEATRFAGRPAVSYSVAGHAVDGDTGYEIEGCVVIDRQTLAYLSIEAVPRLLRQRLR